MKHTKIKLCIVLLFWLGLTGLQAQETVSSAGGNASGTGGSVSYSVGQVAYNYTARSGGFSQSEGVQQAYEITNITGIKTLLDITSQYAAFPNPTTDFIRLKVRDVSLENMFYQLSDMSGKLLEYKKVKDNETTIVMSQLQPATYFLKVIQNTKEVKLFKIIKH